MNKYVFATLLLMLLLTFGCDRFDHNFEPDAQTQNYISDFFNSFADSVAAFPTSIPGIMTFYHDDYNNSGTTKQDMEDFFTSFTFVNTPITLSATLIDTTMNNEIEWRLLATELSGSVFMDTTFTDVLLPTDDSYLFYGNQLDLRNVMVELFTGQWCSNCPNAEEALHDLKQQYGSRFTYVEYHIGDQMAINSNNELFSYYPQNGTLPFGIVNGNADLIYTAPTPEIVFDEINTAIQTLLQQTPEVLLSDVQTNLTTTDLSGSVVIEFLSNIALENLTLNAVLMEVYNDEYLNYASEPHHNIVLQRTEVSLAAINSGDTVTFTISDLDQLAPWYTELPEDLNLVLWVQTKEANYNQSTCAVYNVIEIPL